MWHQYVPGSAMVSVANQSTMNIIGQSKRIYLSPVAHLNGAVGFASVPDSTSTDEEAEFKQALYLGVAPLQRIINEMKASTSGAVVDRFDPHAARMTGMVSYCGYLTGQLENQDIQQRQLKIRKILFDS